MNDQYEDKYIGSHMYHLENVIEKELFNTLRTHCKNDRGLILLLSKEAIDKVMQRTMDSDSEFIYKEMSPMEKNQVLDVPFPCSTGLQSILGPDTFSLLQQYCLWNEEIMIMVFNKAVKEELNSFIEKKLLMDRYKPKFITDPAEAIREMCTECMGGRSNKGYKELIENCVSSKCPVFYFRFGTNPYRSKPILSSKEREARSDRAQSNFSTVNFT